MHHEWLSEAGYRLVFQQYSTGRSFVWLFDARGMATISHEFEYHQENQALREAETMAALGRMREVSSHA